MVDLWVVLLVVSVGWGLALAPVDLASVRRSR